MGQTFETSSARGFAEVVKLKAHHSKEEHGALVKIVVM